MHFLQVISMGEVFQTCIHVFNLYYTDVMSYSTPEYCWVHFVGWGFLFVFIITKYLNQVRKLNVISPSASQESKF